jgi:hypothetical protein
MHAYAIWRRASKMKSSLVFGIISIILLSAGTVFADSGVPSEGVVVEGVNVPGIALGFTRAEVVAAYGAPSHCQGSDRGFCHYDVPEGDVFVRYRGSDGGVATGSDEDVLYVVSWYRLSGWETTAGINTALALEDPDAVIAAYPNATVTYNQWGQIISVKDYRLGIEVIWDHIIYPISFIQVHMQIFYPREPPEPPQPSLRSTSIIMRVWRSRVIATVTVKNDLGSRVRGAIVSATWTLPDGSTVAVTGTTNSYGEATFEVKKSPGVFVFAIDDITLDGYVFDVDNSVLSGEIEVSGKRGKKK